VSGRGGSGPGLGRVWSVCLPTSVCQRLMFTLTTLSLSLSACLLSSRLVNVPGYSPRSNVGTFCTHPSGLNHYHTPA